MGAAASIQEQLEAAEASGANYDKIKKELVEFSLAHKALQRKTKLSSLDDSNVAATTLNSSIHLISLRQLSQNLNNQQDLNKSRHKLLKLTRSLPKMGYHEFHDIYHHEEGLRCKDEEEEEYETEDLEIVPGNFDDGVFLLPPSHPSGPSVGNIVVSNVVVSRAADAAPTVPVPVAEPKPKKKRPQLSLQLSGSDYNIDTSKIISSPSIEDIKKDKVCCNV